MTREEVLKKALKGKITWTQAALILGVTDRQVRRLRQAFSKGGKAALVDGRARPREERRIPESTVIELCRLRRELYSDFSVRHFYEFATEKHGLVLSYTKAKDILQSNALAIKSAGRGKHRRKRERRPMLGMLVHLDASTHRWIGGLPNHDLVVALDDATSEILFARFFEQEGVLSTLYAVKHILKTRGRFCELYTDRGSHFCNTRVARSGPDQIQQGPVPIALSALKITQIWAYSPQARGRSERAFGTLQGRLPQELRLAGIKDYEAANRYLDDHFIQDFNTRFTVPAEQPESAFVPVVGLDLDLLLSSRTSRIVGNDNTVRFDKLRLQIPRGTDRPHYFRCEVTVHEFPEGDLGVSYQDKLLARFDRRGEPAVIRDARGRKKIATVVQAHGIAAPAWAGRARG